MMFSCGKKLIISPSCSQRSYIQNFVPFTISESRVLRLLRHVEAGGGVGWLWKVSEKSVDVLWGHQHHDTWDSERNIKLTLSLLSLTDQILDGNQPGLSPPELCPKDGVDQWRPEHLEMKSLIFYLLLGQQITDIWEFKNPIIARITNQPGMFHFEVKSWMFWKYFDRQV